MCADRGVAGRVRSFGDLRPPSYLKAGRGGQGTAPGLAVVHDGSFAEGVGSRRPDRATCTAATAGAAAATADVWRTTVAARSAAAAGNMAALPGASCIGCGVVTSLSTRTGGGHLSTVTPDAGLRGGVGRARGVARATAQ